MSPGRSPAVREPCVKIIYPANVDGEDGFGSAARPYVLKVKNSFPNGFRGSRQMEEHGEVTSSISLPFNPPAAALGEQAERGLGAVLAG